jgi:ATP-binding cassette subfamily B protein
MLPVLKKSTLQGVDRQTIHIFSQVGKKYKKLFIKSLLFPAGLVLSGVVAPLFISKTIGALVVPGEDPQRYLAAFIVVAIVGLVCNRIGHPALMKYMALVSRDLQSLVLATLLHRSIGFHNNTVGGKLVSDAADYPTAFERLVDSVGTTIIPLGVTLTVGTLLIYFESWPLGIFITIMTMIIVGSGIRDSRRTAPRRARRQKAGKDVTAHMSDTITNIQTAKMFAHEEEELKAHQKLSYDLAEIRIRDWRELSVNGNTRLFILVAFQAAMVFLIVKLVQQTPELLGVGIFAFSFSVTLSNRLFEINLLIRNVEEAFLQASPMTTYITETPEIRDMRGAKKMAVQGGGVVFSNISFAYHDDDAKTVFSNLNLAIKPGEKVGLVGPSGGGKSTLTRLLLRFDDAQSGLVKIDGQDITKVTQKSLRTAISYVPQEPLLFHRTIRENIAYGNPRASLAAVKKAAELAHADEFINQLHRGYDTVVGERGVKLSGGQRQRIAIARAILKDAPILMLDEATSALDSESEKLIQDALWKLMKRRTAIVVAHRLSTIQKMDRIVVLDNGKVAEQGTHLQLLGQKGLYAKLWSHQSGGFIDSQSIY